MEYKTRFKLRGVTMDIVSEMKVKAKNLLSGLALDSKNQKEE